MAFGLFFILFLAGSEVLFSQTPAEFTGPKIAQYTKGNVALPKETGQFWASYDISGYTNRYPEVAAPQRSILNWIIADTGREFWTGDPFGMMNATRTRLYVYHGSVVQQYVSNVVDRFVDPKKKDLLFSIRILTIRTPDWRPKLADFVKPYPVKSKETQGWLMTRANAARVMTALAERSDFRELNVSRNTVPHGQTFGWVYAAPVKTYVRDIQVTPQEPAGYAADTGSVDEGYRFETIILSSTNGEQIEFLFRGESTAVTKMHPSHLKVSTPNAPRQMLPVEMPQIVHCERNDKVSFPYDQVFMLDLGMMPLPLTGEKEKAAFPLSGMFGEKLYCNVLVVIEAVPVATAPVESK